MHRTETGASIEWFGRGVLVLAVAVALLLLVAALIAGWLAHTPPIRHAGPEHDGIELVFFPLAAAVAAIVRSRLGALATLRASRVGPALPLLAAAVLAALVSYLGWSWVLERGLHEPERLLGAALVACAGVAGCVLFPRHTTVLAGAIAAPRLVRGRRSRVPGPAPRPGGRVLEGGGRAASHAEGRGRCVAAASRRLRLARVAPRPGARARRLAVVPAASRRPDSPAAARAEPCGVERSAHAAGRRLGLPVRPQRLTAREQARLDRWSSRDPRPDPLLLARHARSAKRIHVLPPSGARFRR